jgi:CRISPR-associated protein Cas1
MSTTIYLTEPGSVVRLSDRSITVTKSKTRLLQRPLFHIDRLLLFGNIQITAQAMDALLEEGIDVCYLNSRGKYRGKIQPFESKNVLIRVAQYERFLDAAFQVEIARCIVAGKIQNGRALILRYQRNYPETDFTKELQTIEDTLTKLPAQNSVGAIMGSEGVATAAYFRAFGKMFRKELRFEVRTRRPPKDPVNAVLSFGYTLLTNEMFSMVSAHGLDPYIGFLHGLTYGRPSLALDLVEEFRHPFIDRFTLSLFNNEILTVDDFQPVENEGIYLTKPALKRYFEHYERRIRETFTMRPSGEDVNFRHLFKVQIQAFSKMILEKGDYQPFRIYK